MDYIQSMSAPALIWDAMLNITKVELELTEDTNLYLLSEKGIRGVFLIFIKNMVQLIIFKFL